MSLEKLSSYNKTQIVSVKNLYTKEEFENLLQRARENAPNDFNIWQMMVWFNRRGVEMHAQVRRFRRVERAAAGAR